jgi:hypothetical protein
MLRWLDFPKGHWLMHHHLARRCWLLCTATLFCSGSIFGAPVATAAAAKTASKLALKPVTIPAALKQALATKPLFDETKLSAALSYAGTIPQLKLTTGKLVKLEPALDEPPPAKARVKLSTTLTQQLSKYKAKLGAIKYGRPTLLQMTNHLSSQTAIRDQGIRGTCVAHAAVAALEAIYKRGGVERNLSENYAYNVFMDKEASTCMSDPGLATWKAGIYLILNPICEEAESPYVTNLSNACATVPTVCNDNRTHRYVSSDIFFGTAFGGTGTNVANNTSFLEALIDSGYDIVMGFYLAGSDWSDGTAANGAIDVQVDGNGNPAGAFAGHAMLIVGYDNASNYFIVKNSWGTGVGHEGYYYLTYEYVQTYAKYGYVVTNVAGT